MRIKQIFLNILGNAVKFTTQGNIQLKVGIKSQKRNRVQIKITISDAGIGIKDVEMQRIFEKFYQVDSKKDGSKTGTGLGLTILRSLAQLMQRDIRVDSVYGEGTTFTVTLWQQCEGHRPMLEIEAVEKDAYWLSLEDSVVLGMVCRSLEQMSIVEYQLDLESEFFNSSLSLPFTHLITDAETCSTHPNFFKIFDAQQVIILRESNSRIEEAFPG
ncbi:ATP-binding protein [Eubacterium aggregans]|uniref:ATP-binding protein n=1 Tax=Eubacterium aggregans TaxID=81409 RepID=UPI003F40A0A0